LERLVPELKLGRKVILSLGRIHPIKQLEVIVGGFAELATEFPDWMVVFAGHHEDAAYAKQLQQRILDLGLVGRVVLPGPVYGGAKAALLRRTTIYAQASAHENFCVSVAEAFLFKIPCVIAHTVALAADAEEVGCGLACDGDQVQFAAQFRRLMSDPELRKSIGENGPRAAERYYPDAVQKKFAEEYRRCIDEHGSARTDRRHRLEQGEAGGG
jgi:glycosyltransferase involved in cell wall biosynthesis